MIPRKGLHVRPAQPAHEVLHNSSTFCLCFCRSSTRQPQQQISSSSCGQHSLFCQQTSSQHSSSRACSTVCKAIGNGNASSSSSMAACSPLMLLPMGILTDSYKASHFLQYPAAKKMVAVSFPPKCSHTHASGPSSELSAPAGMLLGCAKSQGADSASRGSTRCMNPPPSVCCPDVACSMGSSGRGSITTRRTHAWLYGGCAISWRTMS